jgi:hypothetical protein
MAGTVACQSGGRRVLRLTSPSGSELKSKRRSRGSHQGVFRAVAVTERWRVTARIQPLSSALAGGSSKGWNQSGLRQTGWHNIGKLIRQSSWPKTSSRGGAMHGSGG